MAESQTDDYRRTADITDTGDGWEVATPDVEPRGDVPERVLTAVQAAVDDEPNACDCPVLHGADAFDDSDHAVAYLTARYNEQPSLDPDGGVEGFKPAYMAREDIDAALDEHLPDDVEREAATKSRTIFYEVDR